MYPVIIPRLSEFRHHMPVQLRFNDIDILGHLNNTVYFSLYDTGKAHYLNIVRNGEMDYRRVETVIANVDCAFLHPILFGDEVEVYTRCIAVREKCFELEQMLVRKTDGNVFSLCRTVMVCFDPATGKTRQVPEKTAELLNRFENRRLDETDNHI